MSDPIHYKSEHAKNLALYLKNTVTWADMSQIFGAMDSLKQMFAEFRTQHTAGMSFTDCALSHLNAASGKSSSKSKDDLLVDAKEKKSNDDSLVRKKVKNSRDNLFVREKVHSEREKRERKRSREREKSRICSTRRTKTSGDSSRKRETFSSKNDSRRKRSPSPKRSHRKNSSSKNRETRSKSKESSRANVRRIRSLDKTHSRSTRDPLSRSYFYRCSVSRSHPRPIVLPLLPVRKPLLSEEFAAKIDAKCMQQSVYCPEFSKGLDDDNNNFSQSTKTVWSPTRQSRPSTISPKSEKGEMPHTKSTETSREISFKETRNETRIPARSELVVPCAELNCSNVLSDQTRTSVPSLLSLKFGNNFF